MKRKSFLLVIVVLLTCRTAMAISFTNHRYDAFNTLEVNENSIVFMGNSITNSHEWTEAFGCDPRIVCRGVGSAKTADVLDHIENVIMGHPAKFFLMIGVNDIINNLSPEEAFRNVEKVVTRFLRESPETDIYLESVLPGCGSRANINKNVARLNDMYKAYVESLGNAKVHYIDLYTPMLKDGALNTALTSDDLHLFPNGYQIWCNAVEEAVGIETIYPDATSLLPTFSFTGYTGTYLMRANMFNYFPIHDDNVVLIGDSFIETGEWAEFFHTNKVINRGNGMSYDDLTIDQVTLAVPYILHDSPKPAQIWICMANKMANSSVSAANFKTQLTNLITAIRGKLGEGASTRIVLGSCLPSKTAATNTNYVIPYNEVMKSLAETEADIDFVDYYSDLVNGDVCNDKYFTDGCLAALGYAKMAKAMESKIKEAIPDAYVLTDEESEEIYNRYTMRRQVANALQTVDDMQVGTACGQFPESAAKGVKEYAEDVWEKLAGNPSANDLSYYNNELQAMVEDLKSQVNLPEASTGDDEHWYNLYTPLRGYRYATGGEDGSQLVGTEANEHAVSMWKFEERADGTYNIINRKYNTYIVPNGTRGAILLLSAEEPAEGWEIGLSGTVGLFIIYSGYTSQFNQTNNDGLPIYSWYSNGTNARDTNDLGCQYAITEAPEPDDDTEEGARTLLADLVAQCLADGYGNLPVGDDPGFYTQESADAVTEALAAAQEGLADELTMEMYQDLIAALNDAIAALEWNEIEDGYYYIVCADPNFLTTQGVEKAMHVWADGWPCWVTFREGEDNEVFYIEKLSGENEYSVQDILRTQLYFYQSSGQSQVVKNSATPVTPQTFTFLGAGQWAMSNTTNNIAYHCKGHSSGAGTWGNIITWQDAPYNFGRWYLRRITDEDYLRHIDNCINGEKELCVAMDAALQEAQKAYNGAFSRTADTATPLITKASTNDPEHTQFWTNSIDARYGNLDKLIDNNASTWFISRNDHNEFVGMPYIGVDLRQAIEAFTFDMTTLNNSTDYNPADIHVFASNDKDNGPWTEVAHYTNTLPTGKAQAWHSDVVDMPEAFRFLRFDVYENQNPSQSGKRSIAAIMPQFALGELQVYPVVEDESRSLYALVPEVKAAVDALAPLMAEGWDLMHAEEVSQADIDALTAASTTLNELVEECLSFAYVTIPESGVCTFSHSIAVAVPEGITAWYATEVEGDEVYMTKLFGDIAQNTGVVLTGEPGDYTFRPATADPAALEGNLLVAADGSVVTAAGHYVLADSTFTLLTTDATVAASEAYLAVEGAASALKVNFHGPAETAREELAAYVSECLDKGFNNLFVGTDPGFYTEESAAAVATALTAAEAVLEEPLSAAQFNELKDALSKAVATLEWSDIEDGYYYIVSADPNFKNAQGMEKAMFIWSPGWPCWVNFIEGEDKEVFLIRHLENEGEYSVQDVLHTQEYYFESAGNNQVVKTTPEQTTAQTFTFLGNGQWTMSNPTNNIAYHCKGHSSGAGTWGNIITWQDAPFNFGRWYLRRITDEEYLRHIDNATSGLLDSMDQALRIAQETYNGAFARTADTDNPLITEASISDPEQCQFWTNSIDTRYGNLDKLIDGNPATWYISNNSQSVYPGKPYLGVDLRQAVQEFVFDLTNIDHKDYRNWSPADMHIYASNDKEQWTEVAHFTDELPTLQGYCQRSRVIVMPEACRYLRFEFIENQNATSNGSHDIAMIMPQIAIGELQIYPVVTDDATSAYYMTEDVQTAADALGALIASTWELVENESYTQADIDALNSVAKTLSEVTEKAVGINNLNVAPVSEAIYDLFGRRIAQPVPGTLYIPNGKKYLAR